MGYLRIEHEVANQVILANQGGGILAEIVEDLHHLVRLHYLLEAVEERVDSPQVD